MDLSIPISFIQLTIKLLVDYFGKLNESVVRDNFDIIYQVGVILLQTKPTTEFYSLWKKYSIMVSLLPRKLPF